MAMHRNRCSALLIAAVLAVAGPALAQDEKKEIEKYQRMIAEGSPVELFELEGEDLWKKKQGPKNASLEQCDLGMGPGVVKGAYAHMPRYFRDTDRVEDLEARLVTCMLTLQGRSHEEVTKRTFGNADKPSELEYLVAYIVGQSRGVPISAPQSHAKEKAAYELGRKLFFYRAGAWDFSCASCHGVEGRRIRMQDLPVLSIPEGARRSYATWPAYRVSNSQMKTMQWRLNDCYRQMRFPEPGFASDSTIAMTMFLAVTAEGEPYAGPGTKR
jgi:sulfur-oxidizing protein SoxA